MRSAVRRFITGGDDTVYSGTSAFRGIVPVAKLPALPDPGAIQFWMGPDAHLLPLEPTPTIIQRPLRLQRRCCKTTIRTALAASTARLIRPPGARDQDRGRAATIAREVTARLRPIETS